MSTTPSPFPLQPVGRTSQGYKVVGGALLICEDIAPYRYGIPLLRGGTVRQSEFREQVCTVSVEVLESYLDDLLDSQVNDEALHIKYTGILPRLNWLALGGMVSSIFSGLYLASSGASIGFALPFTLLLSTPFVLLWHFSPGGGLARRLSFAQLVSHEVSRRRGRDNNIDGGASGLGGSMMSDDLLGAFLGREQSLQGAACRIAPAREENYE